MLSSQFGYFCSIIYSYSGQQSRFIILKDTSVIQWKWRGVRRNMLQTTQTGSRTSQTNTEHKNDYHNYFYMLKAGFRFHPVSELSTSEMVNTFFNYTLIEGWWYCQLVLHSQWCGIFHYHWWTASIKPRQLFSHSGLVSWGLPFLQFYISWDIQEIYWDIYVHLIFLVKLVYFPDCLALLV